MSGWSISKLTIKAVIKNDSMCFKLSFEYFWEEIIKLNITIRNGLTNSIGWILGKKYRSIHLFEPFISTPIKGTKNNNNKEKPKIAIDIL